MSIVTVPPNPAPPRRRWAIAAIAAVVAIVGPSCGTDDDPDAGPMAEVVGEAAAATDDATDEDPATEATDATAETAPSDDGGEPAGPEGPRFELVGELPLDATEVDEMIAFIEDAAGRPFLHPPTIVAQDRTTFEDGLDGQFGGSIDRLGDRIDVVARSYQAYGFSEQTPDELLANLDAFVSSADAINGYYDPDSDAVYVPVDVFVDDLFRSLLVHELVHALDGQYIDLTATIEELERLVDDSERSFAITAMVEGRATALQLAWMQANAVVPDAQDPGPAVAAVPPAFVVATTMPYGFGAGWVQAQGGVAATWEAIEAPPTSTEQVLVPTTPATEPIVAVDPPAAEGDELFRGAFGAADLLLLLIGDSLTPDSETVVPALAAVDGWAGGEQVLWGDDAESCVRFTIAADSEADLAEITDAIEAWAAEGDDRTVESGDETMTATACAPFRS